MKIFSNRFKRPGLNWSWLWRLPLVLLVVLCVWLLVFRWVPVPTSAFMLQQELVALFRAEVPAVRHHWVPLDDIPPVLQLAVIASEDQRFAEHWGIDMQATTAAIQAELDGQGAGGGSTITQQLAKNLFLWQGRSYVRKGLEWGIAGLIELFWPKQRILEVYLNTAQFSAADYGISAASLNLLRKPLAELNITDAALLAAVLPAPTRYRAAQPSGYVRARQARILRQMRAMGLAHLRRLG